MRRLFVFLLLISACNSDALTVRVTVAGIPSGSTSLVVSATYGGRDADAEVFSLPGTPAAEESLAIMLPSRLTGVLHLGVSAQDANGCDLGWETLRIVPAQFDSRRLNAGITLSPISPATCGMQRAPGMYTIPADTFVIGCDTTSDPACFANEGPQTDVTLETFQIDRTEVTVGDYSDCVTNGPCAPALNSQLLPERVGRNGIDYPRATVFCGWRNRRLPTEAEWEAAARGTDGRTYPWGEESPTCERTMFNPSGEDLASSCGHGDLAQNVVAARPLGASPYGVFDMAGNMAEWVADHYAERSALSPDELATGPASGSHRIIKGGSFLTGAAFLRAAVRLPYAPDATSEDLDADVNSLHFGFRCAR